MGLIAPPFNIRLLAPIWSAVPAEPEIVSTAAKQSTVLWGGTIQMMRLIATGVLALTAVTGAASAQQQSYNLPPGRIYAFSSDPGGGCPGLDWHVVVQPGNALAGFIAWNHMQSLATVKGSVNTQTGAFELAVEEVANRGRTATVTGKVDPSTGWMTASVQGQGLSCQNIRVPWLSPPPQ
jgi:hypothetical protein